MTYADRVRDTVAAREAHEAAWNDRDVTPEHTAYLAADFNTKAYFLVKEYGVKMLADLEPYCEKHGMPRGCRFCGDPD
jgi:hypothetical protein